MTFWIFKPSELIIPSVPNELTKILNILTLLLAIYVTVKRDEIFKDKSKIYLFSLFFIILLLLGVISTLLENYTNINKDKDMKIPTFDETMYFSSN
jgi:hypothetical protein